MISMLIETPYTKYISHRESYSHLNIVFLKRTINEGEGIFLRMEKVIFLEEYGP